MSEALAPAAEAAQAGLAAHPALAALCEWAGLAPEYGDFWGHPHEVPLRALRELLRSMGLAADGEAEARATLERLRAERAEETLPPVRVVRQGEAAAVTGRLPAARSPARVLWVIECEQGERFEGVFAPGGPEGPGEFRIDLPGHLRLGYHRLSLRRTGPAAEEIAVCQLIVCPLRCYQPAALRHGERVWGPVVQLYALRSGRNWGIGDFSDLKRLMEMVAAQGASMVGLNPLHALFPHEPSRASPYSPSTRNAINVMYIDIEAMPDFSECGVAREQVGRVEFQQRLQALREAEFVDYDGVAEVKFGILEMLFKHFQLRHAGAGTRRGRAFRSFQQARAPELRRLALFDALQRHFHAQDPSVWGWSLWPEPYRDIHSPEVAAFAREHEARVEFFEYLQWQAELQLQAVSARAESLGMTVGLYRDLAVGVNEGGAETWAHPALYALGAHAGAPSEEYNPSGQDWGLPPLIPMQLRRQGYRSFIETLRANMQFAGALRIDHVMSLMRLFWVVPGLGASAGAYVHYPLEDLAGVLALESHRQRCLVIGEDLGNVPNRMREAMAEHQLMSYRPLLFERLADGSFKPPRQWLNHALAVVSTHDLPTLRGYWRGEDIDLRARLGLYPNEESRVQQVVSRAQERAQLLLALEHEGLVPEGTSVHPDAMGDAPPALTDAVYAYLGRTPSQLLGVQLEDVTQQLIQVNVPGTNESQFPNWRRKLSVELEALAHDPRLLSLVGVMQQTRPGPAASSGQSPALPPLETAEVPRATYRVQLHSGFRFGDACRQVPYLQALGVSHLYTSPYLKARAGSTHGYDIIDHNALNPEIGDEEAFDTLCDTLARHGMRQLIDIVPNHMGVLQADNAWWLDVLENGPASVFAETFDIDWRPPAPEMAGQVLLPLLGDHYGKLLEAGELNLSFDASGGEFWIHYHDHRFPIDPQHYPKIFAAAPPPLLDEADQEALRGVESLLHALANLPPRSGDAAERQVRHRDKTIHKRRLAHMAARLPWLPGWITACLAAFNGSAGQPASFDRLDSLIREQAYRLAFWRVAGDDVNYRRFFDVNTLAALRMEREEVFEATHHTILRWLQERKVHGLRVDHPDGLADPLAYFTRLQSRHAAAQRSLDDAQGPRALYVVAEKILAEHERLPQEWPVHGGTGYRFANLVNGLFVDGRNEEAFDRLYAGFIGRRLLYDDVLHEAKLGIMSTSMAADLQVLTEALHRIALSDRRTRDFTRNRLKWALTMVAAGFPVYRTYLSERGASEADRQHLDWATAAAKRRSRAVDVSEIDYLRDVLLTASSESDPVRREAMLQFALRWQQFTAPVMAKAMEDTAFYRYHRLASLNDVGGDPRHFGTSVNAFHAANQYRVRFTPHTLLGSSTHDTKRSEDVRTRLDVLSEMPQEWQAAIERWSALNQKRATRIDAELVPTRNDEYLLYQTLVGVWPLSPPDDAGLGMLHERVQAYMLKAVREAKEQTSWINPNADYEAALSRFIAALLGAREPNPFLKDLQAFVDQVAHFGCFNSLNLVAFKLTSPGVPDIYQGNESWDWSLVDPDNRRPVDFDTLQRQHASVRSLFAGSHASPENLAVLRAGWRDGRLKMLLTWRLLQLRERHAALYRGGSYQSINAEGTASAHVVAYARHQEQACCVTVGSRLLYTLTRGDACAVFQPQGWGDTQLSLPAGPAGDWCDVLTGRVWTATEGAPRVLPLSALLAELPVAVLERRAPPAQA